MGLFSSIFSRRAGVAAEIVPDEPPEADLAPLVDWYAQHHRAAWRPVIGDVTGALAQFGGAPLLASGETMPTCTHCGRDLQLIVEMNLDHVPAELGGTFGSGLLQLFYCIGGDETPEHPDCYGEDGWEAFTDTASRVRVLPAAVGVVRGSARDDFPARHVVAWERFDDVPGLDEAQGLGLGYELFRAPGADPRTTEWSWRLSWTTEGEPHSLEVPGAQLDAIASPATGDKLAGWPYWVQNVEYPLCPRCDSEMQLVVQIDSEDHVPYMWGDCGCGHITQCPQHLDVVAFGWACG